LRSLCLILALCFASLPLTGAGQMAYAQQTIEGPDLNSGEANNGPLILSLMWLQRERARLRASA